MNTKDQQLIKLFKSVNRKYFEDLFPLRGISWAGQKVMNYDPKRQERQYWAVFLYNQRKILINIVLKNIAPNYVLEYLIYHECLHLFWKNHYPNFKKEEKKFKHFKKADQWLFKHEYLLHPGQ